MHHRRNGAVRPRVAAGMTIRRVAVVLNGKAGALLDRPEMSDALEQGLHDAGLEAEFIPLDAGSLPDRVRMAAESGADAVIVAGGDGTVACAGQALAGREVPLGILPFGTMNLLARDLGLPIDDLAAALQAVSQGKVRAIDVGDVNGHTFLCASMLGLPVRLGKTREEARGGGARLWSKMAAVGLRLLRRGGRMRAQMRLDGKPMRLRASSLTISVNTVDESSGRSFGRTRLDGGQLGVYVIERLGLREALRLLLRMVLGRWRNDEAVRERTAKCVELETRKRLLVMNDGELVELAPPLRYEVRPGALKVLVP